VVKGAAEGVNCKNTMEVVKGAAVNHTVKVQSTWRMKRLDADEQQVKTGEIGIEQQVETQTAYILVPVDKQRVVSEISADTEASLRASSADEKSEYRLAH